MPFRENPRIVRGLDYYGHTAFEFVTDRLGAQGTVMGGGRYDGLVEEMGGPPTPSVGWAAGIERLAHAAGAAAPAGAARRSPSSRSATPPRRAALDVLQALRRAGIRAEMAYRGNLQAAHGARQPASAPRAAVILGEAEMAERRGRR